MAVEFYPPSGYEEHPYGLHVGLIGTGSVEQKIAATVAAFRDLCASVTHHSSGTTLAQRLVPETYFADEDTECEFPLTRVAVDTIQDTDDIVANVVDLWVGIESDGRDSNWPTIAEDKASIDGIFAAMAPS